MRVLIVSIVFFLLSSFSFAADNFLDDLLADALSNNHKIKVAFNNWKAEEYKIKQKKTLPNPDLSYTYFGQNVETRVGPQEQKYGISQKIPFPGKLKSRAQSQSMQAKMLKEKYEATKKEIVKKVKVVYFDIFWIDKSIQVTEEEKMILESVEKVAQRRYEANRTSGADVVKIQLELSRLIDKLFVLRQNRKSLASQMNSILNKSANFKIPTINNVTMENFTYSLFELHSLAQDYRQELTAAGFNVERAQHEKSLAKLDYFPDFTFGFEYIDVGQGHTAMYNDGQDTWMGVVKIEIPIWQGKLSAGLNEKMSYLAAAEENYIDLKKTTEYEIDDAYFKIISYRDIVSLYKTALIPQAKQVFEATRTGYESGKVDFLDWLDSERTFLQTRLAHYKAISDYQKSLAHLERITGHVLGKGEK